MDSEVTRKLLLGVFEKKVPKEFEDHEQEHYEGSKFQDEGVDSRKEKFNALF